MRELDDRIERAVGSRPVRYTERRGGYSTADRFRVELADGRSVFVKSAEAPNLAGWIRREHQVYSSLAGSFIPHLEGFDDDGVRPVLALEDLSGADWNVAWDNVRVQAVLDAVAAIAASAPPPDTPAALEAHGELWTRWHQVAANPAAFLSLGVRDADWLDRSLPAILEAAESAPVDGTQLCHLDIRSDNMCFRDGNAVLVDWNWCSLASSRSDLAAWLPSLAVEGGPSPWEVMDGGGELAAWIAGVWAAVAGLPPPETAPNVRALQRRQLAVALDWVDRELF